jgi:hypothetical protein
MAGGMEVAHSALPLLSVVVGLLPQLIGTAMRESIPLKAPHVGAFSESDFVISFTKWHDASTISD